MSEARCTECNGTADDCEGLTKRSLGWICDECRSWLEELGDMDIEDYESQRRERLAEAQEN